MRGHPNDHNKIKKYIKNKKIYLIEDCSQCLGGKINNKYTGSFGDISTFSFQSSKLITAGEGGMVLFNKKNDYLRAKSYHDLGLLREPVTKADPIGINTIYSIGFNFKMSEIHAAILIEQFKKLNKILKNLKKLFRNKKNFINFRKKGFIETNLIPKNCNSNYAFFVFRILKKKNFVLKFLKQRNLNLLHQLILMIHIILMFGKNFCPGTTLFLRTNQKIIFS